jgi:periplasmic divalent cation tolerance protein
MATEGIVILCAVPLDFETEALARDLLNASLAACVQVSPGVTSIYRWKGAIEKSEEKLLVIKTRRELFRSVEAVIRSKHPYDVPEIVAWPLCDGHAPYLDWLAAETATAAQAGR